jgi:hypothetical protein
MRRRPWRVEVLDQRRRRWNVVTTYATKPRAEAKRNALVDDGVRPDDVRIEKHVEFEATS